jgi:2-octaprenyl-6-methoxyphenol hydroxylase
MALACCEAGFETALIDGRDLGHIPDDGRASALAAASMRMLTRLGVDCLGDVQPIKDMLITEGGQASPWKLHFDSQDHGEPTAFMIENPLLYRAMLAALDGQGREDRQGRLARFAPAQVTEWIFEEGFAAVTLSSGERLAATLMIAADGRNSQTRKAAGIAVQNQAYGQSALVTTIAHSQPHDGVALQRFLAGGPLAVLPLTGQRCQIVWSDKTDAINAAMALPDAGFIDILTDRIGDQLGELSLAAKRQSYPLSLQMAERLTRPRLALIGDAAHIIHPLAGQGLNLGFRDVAALISSLNEARSNGQDIGMAALQAYASWRGGDTKLMGLTTDSLNGIFTSRSKLLGHLRRAGMRLIDRNPIAKGFLMSEAAGQTGDLPELMRK